MDAARFLQLLEQKFPDAWSRVRAELHAQRWDDAGPYRLVELFAHQSMAAFEREDEAAATAQLGFAESCLVVADRGLHELIDVGYCENLFWKLDDAHRAWGWARMPPRLRALYAATFGHPARRRGG